MVKSNDSSLEPQATSWATYKRRKLNRKRWSSRIKCSQWHSRSESLYMTNPVCDPRLEAFKAALSRGWNASLKAAHQSIQSNHSYQESPLTQLSAVQVLLIAASSVNRTQLWKCLFKWDICFLPLEFDNLPGKWINITFPNLVILPSSNQDLIPKINSKK